MNNGSKKEMLRGLGIRLCLNDWALLLRISYDTFELHGVKTGFCFDIQIGPILIFYYQDGPYEHQGG